MKHSFYDEDKWITVHPNGPDAKGAPVKIDGETGEVKAGMGGKFNGEKITEVRKDFTGPKTPKAMIKSPEPKAQSLFKRGESTKQELQKEEKKPKSRPIKWSEKNYSSGLEWSIKSDDGDTEIQYDPWFAGHKIFYRGKLIGSTDGINDAKKVANLVNSRMRAEEATGDYQPDTLNKLHEELKPILSKQFGFSDKQLGSSLMSLRDLPFRGSSASNGLEKVEEKKDKSALNALGKQLEPKEEEAEEKKPPKEIQASESLGRARNIKLPEADWESEKAIGIDLNVDFYDIEKDKRVRIFIPKSLIKNGEISRRFIEQKINEKFEGIDAARPWSFSSNSGRDPRYGGFTIENLDKFSAGSNDAPSGKEFSKPFVFKGMPDSKPSQSLIKRGLITQAETPYKVINATGKAVLINNGTSNVWLPLSKVRVHSNEVTHFDKTLAKEKGLTAKPEGESKPAEKPV